MNILGFWEKIELLLLFFVFFASVHSDVRFYNANPTAGTQLCTIWVFEQICFKKNMLRNFSYFILY